MPVDAYTDLAALADLQPPDLRYGRMVVKVGNWWSYPGCPLDGTNIKVPRSYASDARVKAAIADAVWQAFEVDTAGQPVKAVPAPSIWAGRPPLQPHEVGTARGRAPAPALTLGIYRGTPPAFIGAIVGKWLEAWRQGEHANVDGGNLPDRFLTFEMPVAFGSESTHTPQVGDRVSASGYPGWNSAVSAIQYTVKAVREIDTRRYALALARYVPPASV